MLFNTDKSKVMHFGFNNKEVDYILGNQRLNVVKEKRDLGGTVDKSLKSSRQCEIDSGGKCSLRNDLQNILV